MFWFFGHEACGTLAQRLNPHPLRWKAKLTTGPPGKSLLLLFNSEDCQGSSEIMPLSLCKLKILTQRVSVNLLKFSFCQEPGTCTDIQCLFPKPQTLFSKVSHHDRKNPEMVSPSSPPPHTQTGSWGPWQSTVPRQQLSSPGARLGTLRDTLSQGLPVCNHCPLGTLYLGSNSSASRNPLLFRKASQSEQKGCVLGECTGKEAWNARTMRPSSPGASEKFPLHNFLLHREELQSNEGKQFL